VFLGDIAMLFLHSKCLQLGTGRMCLFAEWRSGHDIRLRGRRSGSNPPRMSALGKK
jgi:hypothetical protein